MTIPTSSPAPTPSPAGAAPREPRLSPRDPAFWGAALLAAGVAFIGVRFVVAPAAGAAGFGVPAGAPAVGSGPPASAAYFWTKGGRDVASGLMVAALLAAGERRPLGLLVAAATVIPLFDLATVLHFAGPADARPLAIHGGTALGMAALAAALLREPRGRRSSGVPSARPGVLSPAYTAAAPVTSVEAV